MIRVKINGTEAELPIQSVPKFTDLLEIVKTHIDPEHMITEVTIDGRDLTDEEWTSTVAMMQGETLDIWTGEPDLYVADKMQDASGVIRSCLLEFQDARKGFQEGDSVNGNARLKNAVDTLKAFFEWYGTLIQLVSEERRGKMDITTEVIDISETCKKICQQQMYQSWWALGESLEKDLEPKLDHLENTCRRAAIDVQVSPAE